MLSYNIVIIIDKSTFQLLSYQELIRLSSYYQHNITPILVMEILGDLKKEASTENISSDRVRDFAQKLFPVQTIVNGFYRQLVREDLLGIPVSLDGRPNVQVSKVVQSNTGQKGFIVKQTEEEKAIYKWKDGHFGEAENLLSSLWRATTTQQDLLERLQTNLKNVGGNIKISSYEALDNFVMKILCSNDRQDVLMSVILTNYGISEIEGMTIFFKWQMQGRPLIKDFAPYAFHCLKVDLLFLYGLQSNLIGTRPTNRVDMEYLYYLPFCNVFTSNDKFHRNIVPILLRDDQKFFVGEDLKKDLKNIVEYLDKGGDDVKRKHSKEPPLLEESITFRLWKEYFNYPEKSNWDRNLSEKDKEYMRKKMDEFEEAERSGNIEWNAEDGEEPEFILKKSYLSKNDPCICGSGKRVIDCCIPEDKFNEIAIKHRQYKKD